MACGGLSHAATTLGTVFPPTPGAHACHAHTYTRMCPRFPHAQLAALAPPTRTRAHRRAHSPLLPTPRRRFAPPGPCYPHARGLPPAPSDLCTDKCKPCRAQISKHSLTVALGAHALPNLPGTAACPVHLTALSCVQPAHKCLLGPPTNHDTATLSLSFCQKSLAPSSSTAMLHEFLWIALVGCWSCTTRLLGLIQPSPGVGLLA